MSEPFPDLVEESFEEAVFLWRRWESELTSLTRNLDEIWSWTEDRLHGALDGVRVGGAAALDLAAKELQSDEPDRVTVGAGVLASSAGPGATEAMAGALRVVRAETLPAILRGLELLASDQALRAAAVVLSSGDPVRAGALCRLKAFRRVSPGTEMATAFESGLPEAQVEAVRAARLAPLGSGQELIAAGLGSEAAAVRYAAVETGLCLRVDQAWETARRLARRGGPDAGLYLKLLAIFGTPEEQEGVYDALRGPELRLPAIWALGHIGTVRAAEACLAGMEHEPLARAAGEAYCWMTGADLVRDRLARDEVPGETPPFEADDLDANLVPPPEAWWPLPDPEAVRRHWRMRCSDWAPGVRHVRGRPVRGTMLLDTVETGPMVRRPDVLLELRVRTRGRHDVEPRAFMARQRQMLAEGRAAVSNHGEG